MWAGHQAVIFFFILSGFVLSLQFLGERQAPYRIYLTKRILRIYPPYLIATIIAVALRNEFYKGDIDGLSIWFNAYWKSPLDTHLGINFLMMIGSFANGSFNPVIWSLVHEMRISIIFPLIMVLARCKERTSIVFAMTLTVFCWWMNRLEFQGAISRNHDYFDTLQYVGMFIIGSLLAKHHQSLIACVSGLKKPNKTLILIIGALAYTNTYWLSYYGPGSWHPISVFLRKVYVHEWITAVGACFIVVVSLSSGTLSSILTIRPIKFLGTISYSLYLYHAICLKLIMTLLYPALPLWLGFTISSCASFLVATMSYHWIEVPSINLGKRITKMWSDGKIIPAR
jgi:peptidoglycan/LPS O-acetylase OafA/YrhL